MPICRQMRHALLFLALAISLLVTYDADAQIGGGGRAEPAPAAKAETRVRRASRPTVRRTAPKRTAPASKTAEQMQAEADKFFDADDHDSALAAYEGAVKIKPLFRSFYRIGWIYNEFEEYEKALVALKRAAQLEPTSAATHLELGYAHRRLRQNDLAITALKRAVSLNPRSPISTYELGALYNDLQRYQEAAAMLKQATANKPDNSEAWEELGFSQRKLNLNQDAIASFNRAISLDPKNSGAYLGLGDVYHYGTKNYRDSITAYQQGLRYGGENHIAAHNIAYGHNELGNYAEAVRWADAAVKMKSDYYQAYSEAGYAQYKLGKSDAAIAAYQNAVRLKPDHAVSLFGLGDVYFDLTKNYQLALFNYTKGLEISPYNKTALYRSGWAYNHFRQYQEAANVLFRLIGTDASQAHYHQELGYSYWQLGRTAEAMTTLNRAISLNRDQAVAHYYLGQIYVAQENRTAAVNAHRELQRLNSQYAAPLLEKINAMR